MARFALGIGPTYLKKRFFQSPLPLTGPPSLSLDMYTIQMPKAVHREGPVTCASRGWPPTKVTTLVRLPYASTGAEAVYAALQAHP